MLVLASAVILWSESRGTHDRILLSQTLDSPNLEGQVPVFISPRNRVAQLYSGLEVDKMFWEELIACFSLIRHGEHRK
jgi:hypothetical protein